MVTTVLQQSRDDCYGQLIDYTEERHRRWAKRNGFGYERITGAVAPKIWPPYWDQIAALNTALENNDAVIWLDADAMVVDLGANPTSIIMNGRILMTRHPGPPEHWNCGVMFVKSTHLTRRFFQRVFELGPGCHPWYQQTVMNSLLRKRPWLGLATEIGAEWNSTLGTHEAFEPIISAWHGCGHPDERLKQMKAYGEDLYEWI